ncbi:hypothetical protein FOL47_007477 [Perkinsus chesapeaki]|uniref:Uncharacterized protein n=1 Tax=Perkinsus chesapeaki TaxID=330153 RepID=A0A7J6LLB4_PERCH|nr:hypothetical protein FOL47_007477 [Perkinsus chesapeaki]
MTKRDNSEDFLHSTQESAATNQTTSSAGQDLSRRQREAAGTIARSSRKPRRSGRLQIPASSGVADPPHTHGYHTRSQPLSERQLRKAHGNPIPLPKSELSSPSVPIGRKQKGYSRLSAKQKAKKQEAEETRQDRSDRMVRRLEDDNPLDELSMDMKKRLASYLVLKDVFGAQSNGERADIEARVADMLGFSARTVSAWSREYELAERLAETLTLRGKHPKTRSPIVNPEFEDFRQRLRTFVRTEAVGKGGKPNLTIKAITQWINEELDLDHDTGYSERTVSRWLELLDFKVVTVKKTLYVECSKAVSARSEGKLKCVFLTHRSPIHWNNPDTRESPSLSGNPESNNTDLHEADRRAVELYKYVIKANHAEEERVLSKVTDGSCKADRCDWSALTGGSDPADICPAITQIRELFNEATEKLLSLPPITKLNDWIRLPREQQGSQEDVWTPIIPLLKEEALVMREKLRLLLSVDTEESSSCGIQARLLEAMLNATNADPVSEEDAELLKAIYRNHGAPVRVEVEVPFSSLWPHISKENVDPDCELSYFFWRFLA